MDIPENVLQNIVKQSVNVGDVYLVELNQSDGIKKRQQPFDHHLFLVEHFSFSVRPYS